MHVFDWNDLTEAYLRAVVLIDRTRSLAWDGDPDVADPVDTDGTPFSELREEAMWARIWVNELAGHFALRRGVHRMHVLAHLRETVYPGGWDPERSGDPLDL